MSINTVRKAIQDKNKTITSVSYTYKGVTGIVSILTAPLEQPDALVIDDLPEALVFVGPGSWLHETFGDSGEACKRTYNVAVYVAPVAMGMAGENYAKAEALLQAMGKAYVHDRDIDDSVWHDWTISDGGVRGDLEFGAGEQRISYVGFVLTLTPETWE